MNEDTPHDASSEPRQHAAAQPPEPAERRLSHLDDYEVDDGYADIRGWAVRGTNGLELGVVADLFIDANLTEVSAVEVQLGAGAAGVRGNVVVPARVPIESVRLRPDRYIVVDVDAIPCDDVIELTGSGSDTARAKVPCRQIGIRRRATTDVEVPLSRPTQNADERS